MKKIKVLCLFNKIGYSNIGLENFANVTDENIIKYVFIRKQPVIEAQYILSRLYPNSKIKLLHQSGGIFQLSDAIKKIKPDVIHAHHTVPAFNASILKYIYRFKLLITAHSVFHAYSFFQKVAFYFSYIMSDLIVCNSNNTKISLPKLVFKNEITVVYNGIDFSLIDECYSHHDNKKIRFGTVCRLVPQKDLTTLIKAYSLFSNNIRADAYELVIVGDGPEMTKLKALVSSLNLDQKVTFTGELSRSEVYKQLHKLDIFVVSSVIEGFCNAMVEAASAGKPVIATYTGPLPEVLGKENALFFEPGNIVELSECLGKLFESKHLRELMAHKAKYFVRDIYSIEKSSNMYSLIYLKLAHNR
tara:strand:+ start:94689 stop:95765 length:1077 start_codon:yes stop_codon:yes gene_type:complete